MKLLFYFFTLAAVTALLPSCRKSNTGPCDGDVACTADYRAVGVTLVNTKSGRAVLDSVQTTDKRGQPLRTASGEPAYGMYPQNWNSETAAFVVDDNWVTGNSGEEIRVTFRGFRSGAVVFEERFVIGADCCHVYKKEGPDVITVPD